MSDNDRQEDPQEDTAPEQAPAYTLAITKTPDGRLHLAAPDDFLMVLGMIEWAKEHVWAIYKAQHAQAKAGPKIQVPGLNVPRGRN